MSKRKLIKIYKEVRFLVASIGVCIFLGRGLSSAIEGMGGTKLLLIVFLFVGSWIFFIAGFEFKTSKS